jgi:hypothetical protein
VTRSLHVMRYTKHSGTTHMPRSQEGGSP